ncbi:peroxiredoxin Q/BCP [Natronocella acetinitrilica]|uniref:thioredoxin-dependent peroxiredoxin n=1 Tax=Natronocella acetinitrilica TaxID=414046 RepID=A0AAE3G478_9GAMM|nr:peroxiredoxin [Natronocella acetinitrilica]MCP1674068.1 peroxiredoxin Q/BCP [Natronocella acetinitrilica]
MSTVAVGKPVPAFSLPATDDQTISLEDYRGRNLVLYFYPKASTPGCTQEGQDFRDLESEFAGANTAILGVSRDSVKAQQNFKDKYSFNFPLLSDKDETLCGLFDVIKEKNMYGRKVMGVERSTFVIDAEGVLREEWRGVKVKGHAQAVLDAVRAL